MPRLNLRDDEMQKEHEALQFDIHFNDFVLKNLFSQTEFNAPTDLVTKLITGSQLSEPDLEKLKGEFNMSRQYVWLLQTQEAMVFKGLQSLK